ncbi:MAG: hypothetical protein WC400_01560 [Patescibacteria group bacterium]|jgi:hypothetical protein
MLEELYNPVVPKVYWWKSRAFRISLAIFVGLAVIAVVLFNQQIGDLLRSFGTKAGVDKVLTLDGYLDHADDSSHYFFDSSGVGDGYFSTPINDSFRVDDNHRLMLNPAASTE